MDLPQEIVFFHLKIAFKASFIVKSPDIIVGRPIFYEQDISSTQRAIIIDGQLMESLDTSDQLPPNAPGNLFICLGHLPSQLGVSNVSVIHVSSQIDLPTIFNALQEIYDLFDQWDNDLKTIYSERGGFQEMIDCSENIIRDPISLIDKEFHWIAYCSRSLKNGQVARCVDPHGNLPFDMVNDLLVGSSYFEQCKKTEPFSYTPEPGRVAAIKNLFHQDQYIGRVGTTMSCDKTDSRLAYYFTILEHLEKWMSRLYKRYLSFDQREIRQNSLRNMILDRLNNKEVSSEQWTKACNKNGWENKDKYQLIQFRPNPRYDKNTYGEYMATEIERKGQGGYVCFEFQNKLMLFVNLDRFRSNEHQNLNQSIAYLLRESLLIAGISRQFNSLDALQTAWEQTNVAIECGVKKNPTLWSFHFNDYCLAYMLKKSIGEFSPEQICNPKLLILKQHDQLKGTEYYKTLRTYFISKFNASATAKKLFIHRTSFLNRLERIQRLCQIQLDSQDELLHIAMSFKIQDDI